MLHFLIINAGCQYFGRGGKLSKTFVDLAKTTLEGFGHEVELTNLDDGWSIEEEAKKLERADVVIVQTPAWYMSTPWQMKKYEDEVFMHPIASAGGDGRHRGDPSKEYGTGGVLKGRRFLISSTWNAPREAFEDPSQFFEGRGPDGVFFPTRKAFEFIGFKAMPYFMANDVLKNPTIPEDLERWKAYLTAHFGC